MSGLSYKVSETVFSEFPLYRRAVVIVGGARNSPSPPGLVGLLRESEEGLRRLLTPETVGDHPKMACWREAFRKLGINPNAFRPSVDAIARRVLKGQELPSIGSLVDICNVISLRHLVPVGGHALEDVRGDVELRAASGTETFVPFGHSEEDNPPAGEFVLAEGQKVMTRRWVWRQAFHSILAPGTSSLFVNLDCLPPVTDAEMSVMAEETAGLVREFCGGRPEIRVLAKEEPETALEPSV